MTTRPERHGLGDPRIPWVVLLDLTWAAPPPLSELSRRLAAVAAEAGWDEPGPGAVLSGERAPLRRELVSSSAEPLRLGRHGDGLVLAARHDALDGLAMLSAARRLLGEVRSSARGLPSQHPPAGGSVLALGERAWEVLARPTARVAGSRTGAGPEAGPERGDVFAATKIGAAPRTADLVAAGARAVADWNTERGRPSRRTSVAIGVSTVGGGADGLADASAFLRLTRVEEMSAEQIRAAIAVAPVQPGGGGTGAGLFARVLGTAARLAAPRLGSTLLVSHLGTLSGADPLSAAAFYPVSGGGSGLSLGAATVRGETTLTLRARAAQHDDDALPPLRERVVAYLD